MHLLAPTGLTGMSPLPTSTARAAPVAAVTNETLSTEPPGSEFSLGVLVLLAVLMVLLALVTTLGNVLVILAFIMDRNLRHRSNYYFLNLALSDFAVGVFCIPLYIPYALTGTWRLGRGLCKVWLVVDYVLCAASVFSIVLISYDRFLSVTRAVSYRAQQGATSHPVVKMVATWVVAFLLYCPAIVSWEHVAGHSVLEEGQCHTEFFNNWYFLLGASALEFFAPLLLVTYFNARILRSIRRRRHRGAPGRARGSLSGRLCLLSRSEPSLSSDAEDSVSSLTRPWGPAGAAGCPSPTQASCPAAPKKDSVASLPSRAGWKLQQDKKVAKSLAVIVCVFAACWAPYTLLMIVRGACRGTCVHSSLYEVAFWLLWLNSSLNPFLYPLCHVKFRTAFRKILCPQRSAAPRSP